MEGELSDAGLMTVTEYLKLYGEDSIIRLMRDEIESAIRSLPDDKSKRAMLSQLMKGYDALLKEDILETIGTSSEITAYNKMQNIIGVYCRLFEDIVAPVCSMYNNGFNVMNIRDNATIFGAMQLESKYDA